MALQRFEVTWTSGKKKAAVILTQTAMPDPAQLLDSRHGCIVIFTGVVSRLPCEDGSITDGLVEDFHLETLKRFLAFSVDDGHVYVEDTE